MRENEGELESTRSGFGVPTLLYERTSGDSEGAESEHGGLKQKSDQLTIFQLFPTSLTLAAFCVAKWACEVLLSV